MEQLGKCKSKLSKIHHCHLTGEGRVKKDIFVDFSTKGVPSPPSWKNDLEFLPIFFYKIFIALKWSTDHETVSLWQQPILWTEYFCHFVEWVNKNALVKRGMEVIIWEKKISLHSIFELFAAFFHLANELFT